ncbi:MAG: serine/threonine protein kinase, partial [Actinomycetota bacterium]|nr:serine/threonine protein kinase [Actinomycetota bacterium]
MAVSAGTLIAGRYRIIERVGAGGMGSVVVAQDNILRRRVAIKRLHRDAEDVTARFRREAKLGASLNHPNLVAVYDAVPEEGDLLLIMEYVDGQTLRAALRVGPIPSERVVAILTDVAAALDYMHGRGMVHRDVKPANILLGLTGEVKLADLGISWGDQMTQITASGALLGTPAYLAPELLAGERATAASDVYSLAAVAFEALSGRKAYLGNAPAEILQRIATQPTPHLREAWPDAPEDAGRLLCRGMSPDPSERPATAGDLVKGLGASLVPEPPPQLAPRPAPA